MNLQRFIDYCWSFYGPNEIYGDFYNHKLTREQLTAACTLRSLTADFAGDSIDREAVREILYFSMDKEKLAKAVFGFA